MAEQHVVLDGIKGVNAPGTVRKPTRQAKRLSGRDKKKLVKLGLKRQQYSSMSTAEWREGGRKGYNFYESAQVPLEVSRMETDFPVSLNLVKGRIDTKVGILTAGKPITELDPVGAEDMEAVEAFKHIFQDSQKKSRVPYKTQRGVADMAKCGLAVYYEGVNPNKEQPTIHGKVPGDLDLSWVDPLTVYPDPANRDPAFRDEAAGRWYNILDEPRLAELIQQHPQFKTELLGVSAASRNNILHSLDRDYDQIGANTQRVRSSHGIAESDNSTEEDKNPKSDKADPDARIQTLTCYYMEHESIEQVWYHDPMTGVSKLAKFEEFEDQPVLDPETKQMHFTTVTSSRFMVPGDIPKGNKNEDPTQNQDNYEVRVKLLPRPRVCLIAGEILLYDRPVGYHHGHFPHVFLMGTMHRNKPLGYGEVHNLFEAQTLFNMLNSLLLENTVKTNNSGWIYESGALTPEQERKLKRSGGEPGFTLKVNRGRIRAIDRIEPGRFPEGIYRLQSDLRILFDDLSELFQTQRGGMPYETSGKAVIALQQAADVSLAQLQRHVEEFLTWQGRLRLSNIQQFYTWERAWRVSNKMREETHYLVTKLKVQEDFKGRSQGGAPTLHLMKFEDGTGRQAELLKDFSIAEFDITIQITSEHRRSEEQELEYTQYLRSIEAIDNEAVLEMLNVPGRKRIQERMDQRNQVLALGEKALAWLEEDPQVFQLVNIAIEQPQVLMQVLQQAGIGPAELGEITGQSPPGQESETSPALSEFLGQDPAGSGAEIGGPAFSPQQQLGPQTVSQ